MRQRGDTITRVSRNAAEKKQVACQLHRASWTSSTLSLRCPTGTQPAIFFWLSVKSWWHSCVERESVCYRVVRECWRWKRSQILVQDLSFVAFHANIVPFHLWHWIQSEKVCVHQETCPFEPNSPFNLALKMKVSMWMPLFEMGNRWFHLVPANIIAVATQSFLDMRETVRSILVHVPSPVTIRSQTAGCILF